MTEGFEPLLEKAAQVHGHKCPSLFYGITLGLLAKKLENNNVESIIMEGSSKCIRDGINTVLQDSTLYDKVTVITDSLVCALTVKGPDWQRRFSIADTARQQINQWNQALPVEEFQSKGLDYLRNLNKDELIREEETSI